MSPRPAPYSTDSRADGRRMNASVPTVSHRNGHASVRIDQETYKGLKAYLVDLARRRSVEHMI